MSLLIAQYTISRPERVPKKWPIWELFGAEMRPCGPQWAHLRCQKYFQSSLYILGRLQNTQVAMDASPYNTAFHFIRWKGAQIWFFACNLRVVWGRNDRLLTLWGSCGQLEALTMIIIHLMEVMKHSSCNGYLSLQHSSPFPTLKGYP